MLIAGSIIKDINYLKKQMSKKITMKDTSVAKQILEMIIIRDRVAGILKLSQEEYVKNVLRGSTCKMQIGQWSHAPTHTGQL